MPQKVPSDQPHARIAAAADSGRPPADGEAGPCENHMMNAADEPTLPIVVNGEPRPVRAGCSVAALVAAMDLTGKRIAVERNGEIVPRSLHAEVLLQAGDRLEIVAAVGGG